MRPPRARHLHLAAVGALIGAASTSASGASITFTYTGIMSGTLDGAEFTDLAFTITGHGDTDNRASAGPGYHIVHDSASIDLVGLGSFDFITTTSTAVNNNLGLVVFGDYDTLSLIIGLGPAPGFAAWDMLSSYGPEALPVSAVQNIQYRYTTGGVLYLTAVSDASFQAIVAPAPGAASALFAMGAIASRRHRRR